MFDDSSLTRRDLLKSASMAVAGTVAAAAPGGGNSQRLLTGWEHYRGNLGGIWEVWRGEKASDNVIWKSVSMPHCFNARDAVGPDEAYYQGPGWYRTQIKPANPYPNGRTLLLFEGAGQPGVPAAGVRRLVRFQEGENRLKVVARKDGVEATDDIALHYETRKWGQPPRLELKEIGRNGDAATVQAYLLDSDGVVK